MTRDDGGLDISTSDSELSQLLADVATAVSLDEGSAGVWNVLRALNELDSTSTKAIGQRASLPVPIVAAIKNELRGRGVVTQQPPSRLTDYGTALLRMALTAPDVDPVCDCCDGHGVTIPPELSGLIEQLDELMARAPAVDFSLDQSHCTAATKLRRVLLLLHYGLLPSSSLLLVGDDDLMGLAIALVGSALKRPLVRRLAIVDVAPDLLGFIGDCAVELNLDVRAELVEQDLREPLDPTLMGAFELAMTDPPYTPGGAQLFLSRAVDGLQPGPGRAVAFSYGPKSPDESLRVQETVLELGLSVQAMHRNFNQYHGAGVIGGFSHFQYLSTTTRTRPSVSGTFAGPLYTADKRAADRSYLCLECGARFPVGPGGRWHTIGELKSAGCPVCSGRRFRPLQLIRTDGPGDVH